ncbi:hypothetical protein H1R20_g10992, partial [Candolleomyces eurysporus]
MNRPIPFGLFQGQGRTYDGDGYSAGESPGWMSMIWSILVSITGLSVFGSIFSGSQAQGLENPGLKVLPMLILGSMIEVGRRLSVWFFHRFKFQFYLTARFAEGDPTYDWIILLLTTENVWKRCKDFKVTSKTSQRKWSVAASPSPETEHAEYVPTYGMPQLWRWNGYWIEVTRGNSPSGNFPPFFDADGSRPGNSIITLTIYTFNLGVLSKLVETARLKYLEVSRPHIIVHAMDTMRGIAYGNGTLIWNNVKKKAHRPLESIILEDGVLDSIIRDAREFIAMEEWYADAGIPHRRGYLLHGPPGTGKSSTIYALAGELGMEIYSVSLAAHFVDDNFLEAAASSIPKNSIFLIEDIDCAFPSREELEKRETSLQSSGMAYLPYGMKGPHSGRDRVSNVTLSGLLNVLDGVGSDEGKLFFATTNYIDHLDSALIRPGRIDVKVEYKLAVKQQAAALFRRFYPTKHFELSTLYPDEKIKEAATVQGRIAELAEDFAVRVPETEFSTAELQGYLLGFKMDPLKAVDGVASWVQRERVRRAEKEQRENERKAKAARASQGPDLNTFAGLSLSGVPTPDTFEVVAPTPPPGEVDPDVAEGS